MHEHKPKFQILLPQCIPLRGVSVYILLEFFLKENLYTDQKFSRNVLTTLCMKSELLRMYKSKLLGNKYFFTVCGYLTFSEIISAVQLLT